MMDHHRQNLDPTPPLPHAVELNLPIRLADQVVPPPATDEEPLEDNDPTVVRSAEYLNYLDSIALKSTVNVEEDGSAEQQSVAAVVKESLHITAMAEDPTSVTAAATITAAAAAASTTTQSPDPPSAPASSQDARVAEADLWARQRGAARVPGKRSASCCSLRAYYLWHTNQDLKPDDVAALLRHPPLAVTTVISYITEPISAEKLPFDKRRMREEVLARLPIAAFSTPRYKNLLKACRDESKNT